MSMPSTTSFNPKQTIIDIHNLKAAVLAQNEQINSLADMIHVLQTELNAIKALHNGSPAVAGAKKKTTKKKTTPKNDTAPAESE